MLITSAVFMEVIFMMLIWLVILYRVFEYRKGYIDCAFTSDIFSHVATLIFEMKLVKSHPVCRLVWAFPLCKVQVCV